MDKILVLLRNAWRSVKEECLYRLIVFCEAPLGKRSPNPKSTIERNQKGETMLYIPLCRVAGWHRPRAGAPGVF
jgi:hypothetical protein